MDNQQIDQQANTNVEQHTEPQPHSADGVTQVTSGNQPAKKEGTSRKVIFLALLVLIVIGGGALYLVQKDSDKPLNQNEQNSFQQTSSSNEAQEEPALQKEAVTYTSKLWPDFSFTVPDGWVINEPTSYDKSSWGEGWADGSITATKNNVTVRFAMRTVGATGFEGYTCTREKELTKVGDYYRYTDIDGKVVYADGVGESDEEWEATINGEFSNLEVPNPNYCVIFPFIGTYLSTINQADYDLPYGFSDNEKAIVWLAVYVDGSVNRTLLSEIDKMVLSKSASAEIL